MLGARPGDWGTFSRIILFGPSDQQHGKRTGHPREDTSDMNIFFKPLLSSQLPRWHSLEPSETQQEKAISTAVVGGGGKIGRRSAGRARGGREPRLQGGSREGGDKALALVLLRGICRCPEQPRTLAVRFPAVKVGLSDLKGLFQSN